jgi:hypothetical protein
MGMSGYFLKEGWRWDFCCMYQDIKNLEAAGFVQGSG